jgi:Calcineurin-like phosphoesterase
MPPPDKILPMLRKAIDLVHATAGRTGHLVRLADCAEVLAVGDLHGNVANFQAVWKLADLARRPGRHLVLQELIHGPFKYPTAGEKSHQLVDLFAMAKTQFPDRVHYLPGNHEMGQWTGRKILKGDADLNEQFRLGALAAYGKVAMPDIYRAYLELFQACPLGLLAPNHVFMSHTSIPMRQLPDFSLTRLEADHYVEKDLQPGGVVYGILWGRDTSQEAAAAFLQKVGADLLVTGHIPADEGFTVPNDRQVTLDCSQSPGGYVLFPADRPLTHDELVKCVGLV